MHKAADEGENFVDNYPLLSPAGFSTHAVPLMIPRFMRQFAAIPTAVQNLYKDSGKKKVIPMIHLILWMNMTP